MLLILAAPGFAQEDYSHWAHSAMIFFNTTAAGANVAKDQKNFPVLLRFDGLGILYSKIMTQSMASGADLRFADADGTHLDFQIERWEAPGAGALGEGSQGQAEIWVRVPQIDGNSDKDFIYAYWGNPGATWSSDGSAVFRKADGYSAVWHLGEGGTQTRANSVGGGNHATPVNYDGDERVPGIIGMADSLDGGAPGDYLDVGAGFADLSGGFTFSTWAYVSPQLQWEKFFDFGNGQAKDNLFVGRRDTSNVIIVQTLNDTVIIGGMYANHGLDEKKWFHMAFTLHGTDIVLYKNGAKFQAGAISVQQKNILRTKNYLGHSNWAGNSDLKGILDEPEVAAVARDSDWVRLAYESQRPDAKFLSLVLQPDAMLAITRQPPDADVAEGSSLAFSLDAVSGSPITYLWSHDGVALNVNANVLSWNAITLADAGTYQCVVKSGGDSVVSRTVTLTVPEEYAHWARSLKIGVNTTATGAGVSGDVADFPLLIRLAGARFDSVQALAASGGEDLRFADGDGTVLPYQVERWDAIGRKADIWVRVPKVDGNSDKDYLLMYWGKASARYRSDGAAVFSAQAGFRATYALNETAGNPVDAVSGLANTGTQAVTRAVPGLIGSAYHFGGGSFVAMPAGMLSGTKAFTVGMWARETSQGSNTAPESNPTLFGMTTSGDGSGDFGILSSAGTVYCRDGFRTGAAVKWGGTASLADAAWHYVAASYSGSLLTLSFDGAAIASRTAENIAVAAYAFALGASHDQSGAYMAGFTGDLDAVQVSGTARSEDWIRLAYETQRADSKALSLGDAVDEPPPAPTLDPPAGAYPSAVQVTLTCAADRASIYYSLDGNDLATAQAATGHLYTGAITIPQTAVLKARAYRNGMVGALLTAAFTIDAVPSAGGDTLTTGRPINIDATHIVRYLVQETKAAVVLYPGPAWDPLPAGFDRVGPLFRFAATDGSSAFPGLQLVGTEPMDGISLYRRDADGHAAWMAPKDGALWIPSAGSYFWARDTLPPRIRFAGASALGADSLQAFFVLEDNVANLRCRLRVWNGGEDSSGWRSGAPGEILGFAFRLPGDAGTPLEARVQASDQVNASAYPPDSGRVFTLPRTLAGITAPLDLKADLKWKLAGMPMLPQDPITLAELGTLTGAGNIYAAVWRTASGAKGAYELLEDRDTLPSGQGFWLASGKGASRISFPPGRIPASDSEGLFPIHLKQGWNLVTCPAFRPMQWPVSASDGALRLLSPVKGLRGFDGKEYTRPDSLKPWEGYYVWYGGEDTVVRVGPGAARSSAHPAAAKTAAGIRFKLRLSTDRGPLELGAAGFAKQGVAVEDEPSPPARENGGAIWLSREGGRLETDYVPWEPARAMAWTVVAQGQPQGAALGVDSAAVPEGCQAWAVSPSRRLKYRLRPGGSIPVTGDDTLAVYLGTPEALAAVPDLQRGRLDAQPFASSLRSVPGGMELILDLPAAARLDLSVWSPAGKRLGGLGGLAMGAGRHAWGWADLGGTGLPAQGVYLIRIEARGEDWSVHRVETFGAVR